MLMITAKVGKESVACTIRDTETGEVFPLYLVGDPSLSVLFLDILEEEEVAKVKYE